MMENAEHQKKKYAQYNKESLKSAIEKVNAGDANILAAAKQFHVPYNTLKRKLKSEEDNRGAEKILSDDEEKKLVKFVEDCARMGYPLTRRHLLQKAAGIANSHVESKKNFGLNGESFF
jgi:Tc5 transposase DNA-binding domain